MSGTKAREQRPISKRFGLTNGDLWLLAAASAYWPLGVLAANVVGNPHPERLLFLSAVVWVVAVGLSLTLARLGLGREVAVPFVFLLVIVVMNGGRVLRTLGTIPGWLALVLVLALWFVLVKRMTGSIAIRAVTVGLAVALLSGSLVSLLDFARGWGSSRVVTAGSPAVMMSETPDIFLVVLDGYPGLVTLGVESGDDKQELVVGLEAQGFQTPGSAWSSYWSTSLSIPTLLEMSYPVEDAFTGEATTQDLYDIISGENALLDLLERHDYDTYMVESGWSGSSCSSRYDHCVASPFVDEAMYITLVDTLVGPWVDELIGHPFTRGTEQTMDWLRAHAPTLSRDATPTFVFAHLVAPHPPFYLDAGCERVVSPDRAGSGLYEGDIPRERRDRYFSDQIACVDRLMIELAEALDPEAVVIYVADHGTARTRQLNIPAEEWNLSQVSERFNVFTSIRVRSGCGLAVPSTEPNVLRNVLSCYTDDALELEPIPTRMFMPGMVEVEESNVEALLNRGG